MLPGWLSLPNFGSNIFFPTSGVSTAGRNATTDQPCKGNPILPATGNKIEPELDFRGSGQMPLSLSRTYNHYWSGVGLFGKYWQSNLDYKLTFGTTAINGCYPRPGGGACAIGSNTLVYAWRPDGRTVKYIQNPADGIFYEDKTAAVSRIVKQPDGSFVLYGEDGQIETYSSAGYVVTVNDESAVGWTYTYEGTYPQRVTHTSGRYIELTWTDGQLTSVRDPAGNYYGYAYTANAFGAGLHRLSATSQPGAPVTATAYHYELAGDPSALTGKSFNGLRYSTFTYDAKGYATSSEHNGLEKYTFSYAPGPGGAMTVVETNPLGKKSTYTYEDGKLRTTIGQPSTYCPASSYAETTYDTNGYPLLKSDNNGNDTSYTYNAKGQLLKKIEAYGTPVARTTLYVWDAAYNRVVSQTVEGVSRTTYGYHTGNRPSSVTVTNLSPYGVANQTRTTLYSYSYYTPSVEGKQALGMLQSVTVDGPLPGLSDSVTTNYDTLGNVVSVQNGLGHTVTYSNYNGLGQPGRMVGINGAVTDFSYDARGRVAKVRTYPNNVPSDTVFGYDGNGKLAKVTTADGVATDYSYDIGQRLSRISRSATGALSGGGSEEQQQYAYNLASDLTRAGDWAVEGRYVMQFSCLQPLGAPPNQCNEPDYQRQWVTEPVLKRSAFTDYDELSRPRASRGNNGQNLRYGYDLNGNVTTLTDSLGNVTTRTYDALDRLATSTDPRGGVTSFDYNANDQLIKITDPRGKITSYVYDGFGQLWAQSSPDTGITSFEYDAAGLRTATTTNDGNVTAYAHDSLGRVTGVTARGQTQYFLYDACSNGDGLLCRISDSNGQIDYAYTPQGQLLTQAQKIGTSAINFTLGYAYDSLGRLSGISYPGSVSVGYGYSNGKLTTMTASINGVTKTVASNILYQPFGPAVELTYGNGLKRAVLTDLDGRPTLSSVKDGAAAVQSLGLLYNANDAITKITDGVNAATTQTYGYDALSRLTSMTATNVNQGFAYDAVGNRTSHTRGSLTDTYATATNSNRLLGVSGGRSATYSFDGNGNIVSGGGISYAYDAFNRLASATRSGVTTRYWVNPVGQRTYKTQGGSNATGFVYGPDGQLAAEYNWDGGGWTHYLRLGGEVVGLVRGGQLYFVLNDQLGRPERVTDSAKALVWRANNYAFVRNVAYDSIGGLNLGYPGQYYDAETGNWNNGFRDYDDEAGRYLQSDPIGLAGGLNTYAYVGGNPVMYTDSLGLMTDCEKNAIANAVAQATPGVGLGLMATDKNFTPFGNGPTLSSNPATELDQISGWSGFAAGIVDSPIGERVANDIMDSRFRDLSTGNRSARRFQQNINREVIWKGGRQFARVAGKAFGVIGAVTATVQGYEDFQKCGCEK